MEKGRGHEVIGALGVSMYVHRAVFTFLISHFHLSLRKSPQAQAQSAVPIATHSLLEFGAPNRRQMGW